jgi:hypothetical protein
MSTFRQGTELMSVIVVDYDPTTGDGVPGGTPYLFLIRTDIPSLYYYNGPDDTDWVQVGGAGSGGDVDDLTITGDGTPGNPWTTRNNPSVLSPLINSDGGSIAGDPVYISGNNDAANADAANDVKIYVVGLSLSTVLDGDPIDVVNGDTLTLTTAEWDAVAGTSGGLNAGQPLYVKAGGGLSETPPAGGSGNFVIQVGIAFNTTQLSVDIQAPIGPV